MSKFRLAGVAALLSCAVSPFFAAAQTLGNDPALSPMYANCQYGIAVIFPGSSKQPMIRDINYALPDYGTRPAREFYLERQGNRYSVTVVDFSNGPRYDDQIVEAAAAELRKRGEVRFQAFADYEAGVPGRQLNIFTGNNRQLRAVVYMAYHKLVITAADAVVGDAAAIQFEQSIVLVDANGIDIDRVDADNYDNDEAVIAPCR
jgi:hypothetical protein